MVTAAFDEGLIKKHPCKGITIKWDRNSFSKEILSPDEIKKLMATRYKGENTEMQRAFIFCLFTGLRWCDVKLLTYANVDARFGMPDDDRSWTLDKKDKKQHKHEAENPVNAKMCPHCFAVFQPLPKCPYCGFVFPKVEKELDTANAELEKIEGFKLDFSTPDECKSYSELLAFARKRNYKPGWAYYQAKQRGMI